jgi:hypothetical protein
MARLATRFSRFLTLSTFALAACGGDSNPVLPDISTTTVLSDLGQVEAAFAAHGTFQSLAPTVLRIPPFMLTTGPVVPAALRGKTYVWNSTALAYEVDNAVTGAPAGGVRLRLYQLDPNNLDMPATPLVQLGYADLLDVSTTSLDRLRLVLVEGTTTVGDYLLSGTKGPAGLDFTTAGFLRAADGTQRIDFTGSYTNDATGIDATAQVVVPNGPTLTLEQQADPSGNETLVLELANGGTTVTVTMTYTASSDQTAGTIQFNGVQAASYTWNSVTPVVTAAGGVSLTASQLADLRLLLVRGFGLGAGDLQMVLTPAIHLF